MGCYFLPSLGKRTSLITLLLPLLNMQRYIFVIPCLLALLLSGCSWHKPINTIKPLVVVSVSPYDTFVREIAGDTIEVKVAVPANYNSHVFEPTPKHMQGFQHACMWFGIGEPFEKKLLHVLNDQNKSLIQVDLTQDLPLDSYDTHSEADHVCGHAHDHEAIDLHIWTSPKLALLQTETIARFLINKFPQHKTLYENNLSHLKRRFQELDLQLSQMLEPVQNHAIVISHPSLGYFCQDYNLIQIAIECEGKSVMPSDLNHILTLAKEHPVLCVFIQEQFDNKGALSIARRLQLPVYTINPNDPDYFNNLNTIAHEMIKNRP